MRTSRSAPSSTWPAAPGLRSARRPPTTLLLVSTTLPPASPSVPLPDLSEDVPGSRIAKVFVLVSVGVPTLLITAVMFGFIRHIGFDGDLPFFHFDFEYPALLLANTPTGGDMGAHVLLPQILRDELLPSGQIIGWSTAWYAGFPAL